MPKELYCVSWLFFRARRERHIDRGRTPDGRIDAEYGLG
jgi:hypothetical protein